MSNPQIRKSDILTQELADEILVYDLLRNKAFCLNETSANVWRYSDGTRTISEIADSLSAETGENVLEEIVWLAIDQFRKDNLLEENGFEIDSSHRLSRREAIEKIGAASMIALPLISSILVPTAASAQSPGPTGPTGATGPTGPTGVTGPYTNMLIG